MGVIQTFHDDSNKYTPLEWKQKTKSNKYEQNEL